MSRFSRFQIQFVGPDYWAELQSEIFKLDPTYS